MSLQKWLRDADPIAGEPPPVDADVQRMRRAVVAGARYEEPGFVFGRRALLVAVAGVVAAAVTGVARWTGEAVRQSGEGVAPWPASAGPRAARQLQFQTPGGTRVIWVFNQEK